MKVFFLILAGLVFSSKADAYHVSKLQNNIVDFDLPTRVFLIGYSGGMGDSFVKAASSRARRYQEVFPEDQIIILRNKENANDVGGWDTYLGFQVYETGSARLSGERVVEFLTKFKPGTLKSLDIFSHSSPLIGAGLEKGNRADYFNFSTKGVEKLRDIFSDTAYANIHGCNGGYTQAPALSKIWGVPVSGALASSDFQRLSSDGEWYFNNPNQYPSGNTWASRNTLSFVTPQSWMRGGIRLKPQNTPYRGVWGQLEDGLPFYKFFCSYEEATELDCSKRMAESLLGHVSKKVIHQGSSFEDYKSVVLEFLCPSHPTDPSIYENCVKALESSESNPAQTYASFRHGNEADCDMKSCELTLHCFETSSGTKCKTGDEEGNPLPRNRSPRTIIDEYKRYLQGF